MKTLIPTPYLSEEPFDPREEYADDVALMVAAAHSMGYHLDPLHAAEMWIRHSEGYCAGWLSVGTNKADTVRTLLQHATVIDGPEPGTPLPPKGYATWLDYAVDTMDTRTPYLDQYGQDEPTDHSREAMHKAVQAELKQLRRLAGLVD